MKSEELGTQAGKRVLVTRPKHQVEPLKSDLERLGFEVRVQPTIEILPPDDWNEVDTAIRRLIGPDNEFDWIVFCSTNGVEFFFDRVDMILDEMLRQENDVSTAVDFLRPVRFAVVGNMTEHMLHRRVGRHADMLPETFTSEDVVEHLHDEAVLGKRFLVLRASRGRDVIRRRLTDAGGRVTEVVVYRSVDVKSPDPEIDSMMQNGDIDYVTVTSSAIARSLAHLLDKSLLHADLVSISPITSRTLEKLGFPPKYEAEEASMRGIVEVFRKIEPGV